MAFIFLGFHFLMGQGVKLYEYINGSPALDSFGDWVTMIAIAAPIALCFFIVVDYVRENKI
jgi:hypothetical protein